VKRNYIEVTLRDYMDGEDGWGCEEGRRVHQHLLHFVEDRRETDLFRISLRGVRRTDASFPREGVIELVRRFRGRKGFCLHHLDNPDLLDNWDAAALKLSQPLLVWNRQGHTLIGPQLTEGLRPVFESLVEAPDMTTAEVAARLNLTISNASNKLKSLWESGYILRNERIAQTGGIEFEYFVTR